MYLIANLNTFTINLITLKVCKETSMIFKKRYISTKNTLILYLTIYTSISIKFTTKLLNNFILNMLSSKWLLSFLVSIL